MLVYRYVLSFLWTSTFLAPDKLGIFKQITSDKVGIFF